MVMKTHTHAVAPHSERSHDYSQNAGGLEAHLLVLAPGGSLLQRGDIPDRQSAREVDDGQQGAVGAQAHAEHTVLDVANSGVCLGVFLVNEQTSVPSTEVMSFKSGLSPFHLRVWKTI